MSNPAKFDYLRLPDGTFSVRVEEPLSLFGYVYFDGETESQFPPGEYEVIVPYSRFVTPDLENHFADYLNKKLGKY